MGEQVGGSGLGWRVDRAGKCGERGAKVRLGNEGRGIYKDAFKTRVPNTQPSILCVPHTCPPPHVFTPASSPTHTHPAQAVSVVTSVAWGTTAVGAVMSFHSGGLMQCAYHIQLLAMSANLASPGVLEQYRKVARYFRW